MTDALTREATSSDDIEDLIAEYQKARGPQGQHQLLRFHCHPTETSPWSGLE